MPCHASKSQWTENWRGWNGGNKFYKTAYPQHSWAVSNPNERWTGGKSASMTNYSFLILHMGLKSTKHIAYIRIPRWPDISASLAALTDALESVSSVKAVIYSGSMSPGSVEPRNCTEHLNFRWTFPKNLVANKVSNGNECKWTSVQSVLQCLIFRSDLMSKAVIQNLETLSWTLSASAINSKRMVQK